MLILLLVLFQKEHTPITLGVGGGGYNNNTNYGLHHD